MGRRVIRAALALAFLVAAMTVHALPMDCYWGGTFTSPDGYSECFPGAGSSCMYCEVHG